MHVIRDVCVVPVDGPTHLPNHDVLVEGEQIKAVAPTGGALPEGAEVIDGSGRFLIPGLIDTHVHFAGADDDTDGWDVDGMNATMAELCLTSGVTTVLCLYGHPEVLAMREQVVAGEYVGPTIHTSGPALDDATMTYEQARAEVAREHEAGYDFVKVYNELTLDAYRGIVDETRERGMRFLGHATRAPGLRGVLESGQCAIVHAEEILYTGFKYRTKRFGEFDWANDPPLRVEELPRICAEIKDAGVTVMPNLSAFYAIWGQAQDTHAWHRAYPQFECISPKLVDLWINPPDGRYVQQFADPWARRNLLEAFWFEIRLVEELHRIGVPLTAGTDFNIPGVVPFHIHLELSSLAIAGLGNAGALHAGTKAGGELLEPGTGLGTIVPGARADLVLIDGDPLEDVRNAKRIQGVMARGRWHSRESLDAREQALREAAAAEAAAAGAA